jgi:hypothetical protein
MMAGSLELTMAVIIGNSSARTRFFTSTSIAELRHVANALRQMHFGWPNRKAFQESASPIQKSASRVLGWQDLSGDID